MRYNFLIILFFTLHSSLFTLSASPKSDEVKTIIRNVNAAWQQSHPDPGNAFWDNAVYHTGNMEVIKLLGNYDNFMAYSLSWAEKNGWCGATEPDKSKWLYQKYGEKPQYVLFGDWQICFQTYIDLYNMSGVQRPEMVARAKEVMGYEAHSEACDYWWWADALYMVMPVMTKMYLLTGEKAYLDKMYDNWQYANSIMYDKETGLYFRDGKYVYPKHTTAAGKKDFWARGDGWVLAAFAKVLADMDAAKDKRLSVKGKYRNEITKYYQRLAKAAINLQQEEGHWTRSMMDPDQAPGYETSGTALMCYALFWGVNNGYLPMRYVQHAEKAWRYLETIALQPDNSIGYVQPIGEKAIPGQVVDKNSVSNFGTGAFLLAASEYVRFLEKKP